MFDWKHMVNVYIYSSVYMYVCLYVGIVGMYRHAERSWRPRQPQDAEEKRANFPTLLGASSLSLLMHLLLDRYDEALLLLKLDVFF